MGYDQRFNVSACWNGYCISCKRVVQGPLNCTITVTNPKDIVGTNARVYVVTYAIIVLIVVDGISSAISRTRTKLTTLRMITFTSVRRCLHVITCCIVLTSHNFEFIAYTVAIEVDQTCSVAIIVFFRERTCTVVRISKRIKITSCRACTTQYHWRFKRCSVVSLADDNSIIWVTVNPNLSIQSPCERAIRHQLHDNGLVVITSVTICRVIAVQVPTALAFRIIHENVQSPIITARFK